MKMERILVLFVVGMMMNGWRAQAQNSGARRIHTLVLVECQYYYDWQTVGLLHSYRKAHQPGPITRLLSSRLEVPSMSRHPKTGDWYFTIKKPAGIVHWLKHSKDAENVDWVVILDANTIIRIPIVPRELGAEKGKSVAGYYGYLVGCDNILAKFHTKHPEICGKVGGLLAMHIDDFRALAPLWLAKTEEVREDRAHWDTNYTGDIYGTAWICEMYGYSFGASKVKKMEADLNKRRALFLSIECINTLNEGLLIRHAAHGFPKPKWSKYLSFLRSKTFAELTRPKLLAPRNRRIMEVKGQSEVDGEPAKSYPKIHTIFSTECSTYYDWQTVGLVHSFHLSGQPGNITRLLSCTEEDLKQYKGLNIAPTHYFPSMSRHPVTGDWYPAIHKPAGVVHWLDHAKIDAEYIVILESDMIMRGPITPWEFHAAPGRPVATPYEYLIGCDNELAKIHTNNPDACNKVGGVIIMHINDLRRLASLWLRKTEELRADRDHWSRNITGDVYESGWISEMYGYSFGAAELNLRHVIRNELLIYPGYVPVPGVKYRIFHYGLEFRAADWSFDKARWRHVDLVNKCWAKFPDPPDPSILDQSDEGAFQRDLLSIECAIKLNEALHVYHESKKCSNLTSLSSPNPKTPVSTSLRSPNRGTPDPRSLQPPNRETSSEITTSRKLGKSDEASRHYSTPGNESHELLLPSVNNQILTSMKIWIIMLWAVAVFGFVALMSVTLSSRKGQKRRGKSFKIKGKNHAIGFVGHEWS